ncbi:putative zinc-binding metallopeptidase [Variovorax sp. KK3]|uniref:zinc-binding metallopeptidase family protein n=1 Tax=Variovorax sp. KK3 TaxID=1855728 RepID=UPI00097C678C|nr:putative zinc-binding peptidase [Variovorax sp. KK3]
MKLFQCPRCGSRVFFENLSCESCKATLGYSTDEQRMLAFEVSADGAWGRLGDEGPSYRPCVNTLEGVCNWLVPSDSTHHHCVSCRTTHTIPALSNPLNRAFWARLEQAKRRLFVTLLDLGLPVPNKLEDPANGLSFEFLEETSTEMRVLTGHDEGVITLNIGEADDAHREQVRQAMHEPYRTLLGHFRHEIGHYYWDRLVRGTPWIDECRALFGDDTKDYAQALREHYANPPADWPLRYISVYASSHPWEDWAETWAHYLHVADGLDTAAAWGLQLAHALPGGPPLTAAPLDLDAEHFGSAVVEQWLPVSQFVNAMDRSLGANDSYPFIVIEPVVAKLDFVHRVVRAARRGEVAMNYQPQAEPAPAPILAQESPSVGGA